MKEDDVLVRPPGFMKRHGMAFGKKVVPASSSVVKKKGTHSSLVAAPSSSSAGRSAAIKLVAVKRKEKKSAVVLEVDTSSDSKPLVGKCSHCFNGSGKMCCRWMCTGLKCGQVHGSSSNPDQVNSNYDLLI
jgi:hypothetical protein